MSRNLPNLAVSALSADVIFESPKVEADDDCEMGLGDDDPTDADYGKTALHLTVLLFKVTARW